MNENTGIKVCVSDWIIWFSVALFITLFFSQDYDMRATVMNADLSMDVLKKGKILEFYEYSRRFSYNGTFPADEYAAIYNIVNYLIVGIINLPFSSILHRIGQFNYENLLIWTYCVFFFLTIMSAILFRKIAVVMYGLKSAKTLTLMYLQTPILMYYLQFKQIDIVYVLLILGAVYYWVVRKKFTAFTAFIAISLLIKPYVIFLWVPWLLLREKRIGKILLYFGIVMFPVLIFYMFYGTNQAYILNNELITEKFNLLNKFIGSGFGFSKGWGGLFFILFILLCLYCHQKEIDEKELWKYVFVIPNYVFLIFLCFLDYHPQNLILFIPFWVLVYPLITNQKTYIISDILLQIGFLGNIIKYSPSCDNYMINHGILPILGFDNYTKAGIIQRLATTKYLEIYNSLMVSLLVAGVLYCTLSLYRETKKNNIATDACIQIPKSYLYLRFIPIILLDISILIMYFY